LTGSHYTTLQALEGALPRDEIKTVHAGSPLDRYAALREGRIAAAALMEPYISLALKDGAHLVAVTFYRGSQVISANVNEAQRTAYVGALNEAADLINADFDRYKHYIVKPVQERLTPAELSSHFVHYTHGRTIDELRFGTMYDWMHSWGLTDARQSYATLVS
jgi:NitT/TauT family transport system substrate-binding protein